MSSFFYLLLAALLAWYAGPWLTTILWFLPIKEIVSALVPRNIWGRDGAFYVSFLLWLGIIWTTLKATRLTFLFAGPQSFGNTKLVRRIHGLTAGALGVFMFVASVIGLLLLSGVGKNLMLDRMQAALGPAFLEIATAPMYAHAGDLDQQLVNNASARPMLTIEHAWERFKDVFHAPENQGKGTSRIERQLDTLDHTRSRLLDEQQDLQSEIATFTTAYDQGDRQSVVREAVWKELMMRPWRLAFLAFKYLWWLALPVALPLYVVFKSRFKAAVARLSAPILRFFDRGRFGKGGAGRFAGLLEEWTIAYRRTG